MFGGNSQHDRDDCGNRLYHVKNGRSILRAGDLVNWNGRSAIVTEVYESKVWRTQDRGIEVNFKNISPEPFARILVDGALKGVPQADLEVINEGG